MTAITLPSYPRPTEPVEPELLEWGSLTQPAVGGAIQATTRLGSRYQVTAQLPAMNFDDARAWIGARLRSKTRGLTCCWNWPQPEGWTATGLTGALVKGAGQTGPTLTVDGLAAGVTIKPNTPFSFVMGGRHYLHLVDDQVTADGAGEATLSISPMTRVSPSDNLALEFLAPVIEGFFREDGVRWTVEQLVNVGIDFTLFENA